jgi:hypothetical protein
MFASVATFYLQNAYKTSLPSMQTIMGAYVCIIWYVSYRLYMQCYVICYVFQALSFLCTVFRDPTSSLLLFGQLLCSLWSVIFLSMKQPVGVTHSHAKIYNK